MYYNSLFQILQYLIIKKNISLGKSCKSVSFIVLTLCRYPQYPLSHPLISVFFNSLLFSYLAHCTHVATYPNRNIDSTRICIPVYFSRKSLNRELNYTLFRTILATIVSFYFFISFISLKALNTTVVFM